MNNPYEINWLDKVKDIKAKTPFLVMDLDKVSDKIHEFKTNFAECKIYYAIKAFDKKELIEYIDNKVAGFDIASYGEFKTTESLGIDPERILFSNPVKNPEHIVKTYKKGVRKYSFDSHNELVKLAKYAPGAEVYLRIKVSDHGSAFPLSGKFGASVRHAVPLMDTALSLGLEPVGITFHVGSQSESMQAWDVALESCGEIMKKLQVHGIKIKFLNIGGGFPVEYTEKVPDFEQIAKQIRASVEEHIPYAVELYAEPGRFLVAEAGLMVSTIIGREKRDTAGWLFLDVGSFNGLIEPIEVGSWEYPVFCEKSIHTDSLPDYFTLTGPTCDPDDTFSTNTPLPSGVQVGDRVFIGSAGAYTVVYASNFNGFDIPSVIYISGLTQTNNQG
jgi:ornithine decarboxylase